VKAYDGLEVELQCFLAWASEGVNGQLHVISASYALVLTEYKADNGFIK
jgi:hypothetical protein